jgi:hypothetical protein
VIGVEQEPSREALDRLNKALGEGQYTIEYRQAPNGVAVIVQTRELPSRAWTTHVQPGVPRASVDAVWQEFTSRITSNVEHERKQEQARSAGYRATAKAESDEAVARTEATLKTAAEARADIGEPVAVQPSNEAQSPLAGEAQPSASDGERERQVVTADDVGSLDPRELADEGISADEKPREPEPDPTPPERRGLWGRR